MVAYHAAVKTPVAFAPAGLAFVEPCIAAPGVAPTYRTIVAPHVPAAVLSTSDIANAADVAMEAERAPLAVAMPGVGLFDEVCSRLDWIVRRERGGGG